MSGTPSKTGSGVNLTGNSRRDTMMLVLSLVVVGCLVSAVYRPVLSCRALSFDDSEYLIDNQLVQNPSWQSTGRFLTEVLRPSTVRGYYQPLAMISLMTDYWFGGRVDNMRQFRRTSLALHVLNTLLTAVLLYLLFGQVWPAAAVSLLFGLHPMTIEPIAWISDRKTLLAAFFSLLSLICYVKYAKKIAFGVQRTADRALKSKDHLTTYHLPITMYAACLAAYVLALMSKPTSTMLPALMLLLDFWPLNRLGRRAVFEKIPFFAVMAVFAFITYVSQSATAVVKLPSQYGILRIPFILCHNIIFYPYKFIWPVNISWQYAFPERLGLSDPMVLAGVVGTCVLIPLLVVSLRWTRAALTSWLFFFAAIMPAMQIVGFSDVIAADKHCYLPSLGFMIAMASLLVWFCGSHAAGGKGQNRFIISAAVILFLSGAEAAAMRHYLVYWKDTANLFGYIVTMNPDSAPVQNNLGYALKMEGRFDEAVDHFRLALKADPHMADAHNNLGVVLKSQGKLKDAITHFRHALNVAPANVGVLYNLGNALQAQGKLDEAIDCYSRGLRIKPDYANMHYNLANTLKSQNRFQEAIDHYRQALKIKPDYIDARYNLALVFQSQGQLDLAAEQYREVLKADSGYTGANNNLGIILGMQNKFSDAVDCFQNALESDSNNPEVHNNLANTLLVQDKFDEAMRHYLQALQFRPNYTSALVGAAYILSEHTDKSKRDVDQAVKFAEHAAKLTGRKDGSVLKTLAAAYAAAGQFDKAEAAAVEAISLLTSAGDDKQANFVRQKLQTYRQGRQGNR